VVGGSNHLDVDLKVLAKEKGTYVHRGWEKELTDEKLSDLMQFYSSDARGVRMGTENTMELANAKN